MAHSRLSVVLGHLEEESAGNWGIETRQDSQASYLDEQEEALNFDDGYTIHLREKDLDLSLDRIAKLHGINAKERSLEGPTPEDASRVLLSILSKLDRSRSLYCEGVRLEKLRKAQKAESEPFNPSAFNLDLSVNQVPSEQWTDRIFKAWYRFLKGDWLEIYIADRLRALVPGVELSQGVDCWFPSKRQFEVDVAAVREHRLYLVSCTTDRMPDLCKSKLFEVALRARQLGGDLARSALVCLLDGSNSQGPYVDQLWQDVESMWAAPNTPLVFGAADLREWIGFHTTPNTGTLQEWLDS